MSTGGPGHTHRFDPVSGWCAFCVLRDDGRLVGTGRLSKHGGSVFRAGTTEHTEDEKESQR